MEYFILGEKSKKEFRDPELLDLFHGTDSLERIDRNVIKRYIRKYLKAKQVLDELTLEAEEEKTKKKKKSGR